MWTFVFGVKCSFCTGLCSLDGRKLSGEEGELGEEGGRHTSSFYISGFIGVHYTAYAHLCLSSNGLPEIILGLQGEEINSLKLAIVHPCRTSSQ